MSSLTGKDIVGNYSAIEGELVKPANYTWPDVFLWKYWMQMWKLGIKKHGNGRNSKDHWVQTHPDPVQTHPPPWNLLATCQVLNKGKLKEQKENNPGSAWTFLGILFWRQLTPVEHFQHLECSFLCYLIASITLLFISINISITWIVSNLQRETPLERNTRALCQTWSPLGFLRGKKIHKKALGRAI